MNIRFWGVRGSLPAPITPSQIQSKISATIERITPADIKDELSRERFLSSLPQSLFGTIGGNTPCVEIQTDSAGILIFDAGTGLRELGLNLLKRHPKPTQYRIFFTHFHWDHIQGLPFFAPAFDPAVKIDFYAVQADYEKYLKKQMESPFFPVTMEVMGASKQFNQITEPLWINEVQITTRPVSHPGSCYAYSISENRKRCIFATDIELSSDDFNKTADNIAFFDQADVLIMDSQYTLEEAINKRNWGHNAFSLVTEFAHTWRIKHLIFFHHDPAYNDKKLYGILDSAKKYMNKMGYLDVKLYLASEGMEINL